MATRDNYEGSKKLRDARVTASGTIVALSRGKFETVYSPGDGGGWAGVQYPS